MDNLMDKTTKTLGAFEGVYRNRRVRGHFHNNGESHVEKKPEIDMDARAIWGPSKYGF